MKRLVTVLAGGRPASVVAAAARRLPPPASITVLTYHRVAPRDRADHLFPGMISADPATFAQQLDVIERYATVLSMDDLLEIARDGRWLRGHHVVITFDDAYRDVAEHAWPLLRQRGLPATLFVPTAYPDAHRSFWWDRLHAALLTTRRSALGVDGLCVGVRSPEDRQSAMRRLRARVKNLPNDAALAELDGWIAELRGVEPEPAVLSWDELRGLSSDGMTIASHTATHPLLTTLSQADAFAEIASGMRDLTERLGASPPVFAYPSGAYDTGVVEAAREAGVVLAFSTRRGSAIPRRTDWLRIPRVNVGTATTPRLLEAELAVLPRISALRARTADQ